MQFRVVKSISLKLFISFPKKYWEVVSIDSLISNNLGLAYYSLCRIYGYENKKLK